VVAPNVQAAIIVAVVELILVAAVSGGLLALLMLLSRRAAATRAGGVGGLALIKVRKLLIRTALLSAIVIVGYNGWLVARGVDVRTDAATLLRTITVDHARLLVIRLAQLGLIALAVMMATRLVRGVLRSIEQIVGRWDRLADEHRALAKLFDSLDRAVVSTAWLLGVVVACRMLAVPAEIAGAVMAVVTVWAVLVFGIPFIRSTGLIIGTAAGLARSHAHRRGMGRYYDHLQSLLPTLQACLEYALWIALVSLAQFQVTWLQRVARLGADPD
jgi:hypothetical protein